MNIDRRTFLGGLCAVPAAALFRPLSLLEGPALHVQRRRTLVLLHLQGGNDGLNTVVPHADPLYRALRAGLALEPRTLLPIDDRVAFHPSMRAMRQMIEDGRLAVIEGVGYPDPDFSHFRSTTIWQTASPDGATTQGWAARLLERAPRVKPEGGIPAVALGREFPEALLGSSTPAVSLESFEDFRPPRIASEVWDAVRRRRERQDELGRVGRVTAAAIESARKISQLEESSDVRYPGGRLAASLRRVAALIEADLGLEVLHLSFGGFDTHVNQLGQHATLLQQVSESLAAFDRDCEQRGVRKEMACLVYSEFGRRPQENNGGGTDHGSAGPMFALGGGVRPGVFGRSCSLEKLDDGNLVYTTDFRRAYGTVAHECFGIDPATLFPGHDPLDLFDGA